MKKSWIYLFFAFFALILLNLRLRYQSLWVLLAVFLAVFAVSRIKKARLFYKKKRSKIKLSILTVIFCLLIIEAVAGIYLPRNVPNFTRPSEDTDLVYELREGFSGEFSGVKYKFRKTRLEISSQGLRDREFEVKKPENTFRIACVGDSTAFGWGVELNESFCKLIEVYLNSNSSTVSYETMNFGVPGYNAKQIETLLRKKVIGFSPDMVIYGFDMNDVAPALLIRHNKDALHIFLTRNFLSYRFLFVSTYGIINRIFNNEEQKIGEFKERSGENDLKSLLGYLDHLKNEENISILAVMPYCKGRGDQVIANKSYTKSVCFDENYRIPKDTHANALGHQLIAEEIMKEIKERGLLDDTQN